MTSQPSLRRFNLMYAGVMIAATIVATLLNNDDWLILTVLLSPMILGGINVLYYLFHTQGLVPPIIRHFKEKQTADRMLQAKQLHEATLLTDEEFQSRINDLKQSLVK